MAIRLPDLRVSPQVSQSPGYDAPRTIPQQDATGEQLQQLGGAAMQAGYGVQRVADFLQDQVDEAKAIQEYNAHAEEIGKLADNYQLRKGEDAVTGLKGTLGMIQASRRQREAKLDNPTQRKIFASRADQLDARARSAVESRAAKAALEFNYGVHVAGAQVQAQGYQSLRQSDPAAAQLARDTGLWHVRKASAARGDNPDELKLAETEFLTGLHSTAVKDLLSRGYTDDARDYFQKNRDEIDPNVRPQLQHNLHNREVDDTSFLWADKVSKMAPLLEQQREIVVGLVNDKKLTAEEGQKTYEKLRVLDMERQEAIVRVDKAIVAGAMEKIAAGTTYDALPQEQRDLIVRSGLLAKVMDGQYELQAKKLAASKHSVEELDYRDTPNIAVIKKSIQLLKDANYPEGSEEILTFLEALLGEAAKKQAEGFIPPTQSDIRPSQGVPLPEGLTEEALQQFAETIGRMMGYQATPQPPGAKK